MLELSKELYTSRDQKARALDNHPMCQLRHINGVCTLAGAGAGSLRMKQMPKAQRDQRVVRLREV